MFSPTAGLVPSLTIGALALLVWLRPLLRSGRLSGFHAIGAGAATFAASFSLLNILVQLPMVTLKLLSAELANGLLALRVISVTTAVAFVRLLVVGMKDKGFELSGDYYGKDYRLIDEEDERRRGWPPEQLVSQATVILLSLCLLWALPLLNRTSLSIALLNWSFAFTADDYFMAVGYRTERKVLAPKFEAGLIWVWRTLTLVLFGIVMFQQFAWWLASLTVALVIFLLGLPRLTDLGHALMLWFSSWGIVPPEVEEALERDSAAAGGPHSDAEAEVAVSEVGRPDSECDDVRGQDG